MSKKMCIFAADLGIVPSVTIKSLRVMKRECVFRIEVEGLLWRVVAEPFILGHEPRTYRIMHRRRCYAKLTGFNAQLAIEQCLVFALGCGVDIHWGSVL